MAGQVNESNDLGGLLTDFGPVQTSSMTIWFIHHLGTDRGGQSYSHILFLHMHVLLHKNLLLLILCDNKVSSMSSVEWCFHMARYLSKLLSYLS